MSQKKPPDKAVVLKVALAGFYKALRKLN
ncbi:uncharacterized protein METZ01_LOCUS103997 [marine metagenome]|uniref:Uncharacterized protein n=1 Tax=marine metagenome TaxID=408172 RepID=A0A381WGT2_9ZZZZ